MEFKYKSEWPLIAKIAADYNFGFDKSILLMAILEVSDENSNELHILEAKNKDIEERAKIYTKWLRNRDYHYQNYIKRLEDKDGFDFIEYVMGSKTQKTKNYIKLIEQEFNTKEIA